MVSEALQKRRSGHGIGEVTKHDGISVAAISHPVSSLVANHCLGSASPARGPSGAPSLLVVSEFDATGRGTSKFRGQLVYDEDCGACTWLSRWLMRSWNDPDLAVVSYQQLGERGCARLGFTLHEAEVAAWWVDDNGVPQRGHRAIAGALSQCSGWRRFLARFILVPGCSALAAAGYATFARLRHRLPGSHACAVPASPSP